MEKIDRALYGVEDNAAAIRSLRSKVTSDAKAVETLRTAVDKNAESIKSLVNSKISVVADEGMQVTVNGRKSHAYGPFACGGPIVCIFEGNGETARRISIGNKMIANTSELFVYYIDYSGRLDFIAYPYIENLKLILIGAVTKIQ